MDDKELKAIEERTNRYCTTIEDYKQAEQDRDALLAEVKRLREEHDRMDEYALDNLKVQLIGQRNRAERAEKRCEAAIRDAANGCCATCKHHKWVNGKMTCNREGCKWEWRDIQESSDEI